MNTDEKEYDLSSLLVVESSNGNIEADDCPITEWKMCEDEECLVPYEDVESTFNLTFDVLRVNFQKSLQHKEIYVGVITRGKVQKAVPIKVNICGYESIITTEEGDYLQNFNVGDPKKLLNLTEII